MTAENEAPEADGTTEVPPAPETGQEAGASETGQEAGAPDSQEQPASEPDVQAQLDERTADLQRLQAEYLNYKRRVEREREQARVTGREEVFNALLTVLDNMALAEQHEELTEGVKAVFNSFRSELGKWSVESFGAQGEPFDPEFHEAVAHAGESADVEVTSIAQVMQIGYRAGDKVLRPAIVAVVDPAPAAAASEPSTNEETTDTDL